MKRLLFVFPNIWDQRQLQSCRAAWTDLYDILFTEPTAEECPWDFDLIHYIDRLCEEHRGKIDGVLSSSDYPGATVAAAIATQLGLPGSHPEKILRCSHKYYSRREQQASVPEATPQFDIVDPRDPLRGLHLDLPFFIKPVKGAFSQHARRIDSEEELQAFLKAPAIEEFLEYYLHIFNRLVRRYTDFEYDGSYFIAEELLQGDQVTVEGFVAEGKVQILAVVDSIMFPGTGSFSRFDYPSSLENAIQERMEEIARRVIQHQGLDNTFFNIEMMYAQGSDRIHLIEINPRMCGQFGDLYQKVDGMNSYQMALAIAAGEFSGYQRRSGRFPVVASFPLRIFEFVRVAGVPDEARLKAVESEFPGTLVWVECEEGQQLTDFEAYEDGESYRYGVVNTGAASRGELLANVEEIKRRLGFEFVSGEKPS